MSTSNQLRWGAANRDNYAQPRQNRISSLAQTAELALTNEPHGYAIKPSANGFASSKAVGNRGATYFERPTLPPEDITAVKGSLALLKSKMKHSTTTTAASNNGYNGFSGGFSTISHSNTESEGILRRVPDNEVYTADLYMNQNSNYRRQFRPSIPQEDHEYDHRMKKTENEISAIDQTLQRKEKLLSRVNQTMKQQQQQEIARKPTEQTLPPVTSLKSEESALSGLKTRLANKQSLAARGKPKFEEPVEPEPASEYQLPQPPARNRAAATKPQQAPPPPPPPAPKEDAYVPSALQGVRSKTKPQPTAPKGVEDSRPAIAAKNPASLDIPPEDDGEELIECPEGCGRKFKEHALDKHVKVCQKVFQSKRPKFDSAAARAPDDPEYVAPDEKPQKGGKKGAPAANSKKGKWKAQSDAFRAGMKAARGETLSPEESAALNSKAGDRLTKCPHCSRSFNPESAEKHIAFCGKKAQQGAFKKPGKR